MTEKSGIKRGDRVLDVGTGSGYQAAVAAELGAEVYSIEIIPELAQSADERLKRLGLCGRRYAGRWLLRLGSTRALRRYYRRRRTRPRAPTSGAPAQGWGPAGDTRRPSGQLPNAVAVHGQGDELEAENLGGVAFVPLTGER